MKPFSILFASFFLLVFTSCRKEKFIETSSTNVMSFNDTCSYTMNGNLYTCSGIVSRGWGTAGAHNDPRTGISDPDSIMFTTYNELHRTEGGLFRIDFRNKYGKNQFDKDAFSPNTPLFTSRFSLKKVYDTLKFFALGERKYALDYDLSTNNQEGVAISRDPPFLSGGDWLTSYPGIFSQFDWGLPPSSYFDIQNNSYFEILKYYSVPIGGHALEAKFSANMFNSKGQMQRIDNGRLLIHVY